MRLVLLSSGLGSHPSRSQPDRTRREDHRLKFYDLRDNLDDRADVVCAIAVVVATEPLGCVDEP
jgi:hypothetical protein